MGKTHHYLRKSLPTDRKRYFDWTNDPQVREASFSGDPIGWEEHKAWYASFMERIAEGEADGFVLMDFFMGLGQVRIEPLKGDKNCGVLSYSIAEEFRGKGCATELLLGAEKKLAGRYKRFRAEVKPENTASIALLKSLGYKQITEKEDRLVFEKDIPEKTDGPTAAAVIKKPRDMRFEALRVIAMLMIILLHYLDKGNLLEPLASKKTASNYGFWFLEAMALCSVNVYVMISGYFAVDARFSLRKFLRLWAQVFFYSVIVAAVIFLFKLESFTDHMNLYELSRLVFPISSGHYWFATVFLLLTLFAPFLGQGMKKLSKIQFQYILICLLCFSCGLKTVFPEHFAGTEDHGVGLFWFLTVFLLAGYIRLYGLPFAKTKLTAALWFVLSSLCVLPCILLYDTLEEKGFMYATLLADDYNHGLILLGSLGLFMLFANMKSGKSRVLAFIGRFAPYAFGVYLLHEHIFLQYLWPKWLHVEDIYGPLRALHIPASLVLIFAVGAFVDFIRSKIFALVEDLIDWACGIYYAKKEVWDYLIAGFAATVVSWLTYFIFAMIVFAFLNDTWRVLLGNAASWTITVVFAYVVNRVFVFHSETKGFKAVGKEFVEFVAARLFSFGLEELIMFVFVTLLGWNELLVKILIASIVVIVLNYFLSKLWIFKKPAKEKEKTTKEKTKEKKA
ncbi:MAG: GNAT family N-acetyltransferase [Lachnospiraceae bacterium]|nr:GNAT family N-acetyltransferase [Lachnospiraceae bacterium]